MPPYAIVQIGCKSQLYQKLHTVILFTVFASILLTIVFFQYPLAEASERPIAILKSDDVEAYNSAAKGVLEALKGQNTQTYTLSGDVNRIDHVMEKVSLVSPKAVIAVGSLAVLALKVHPINVPVVFCLVVNHSKALEIPGSWGISMHLPASEAYERIRQVLPRSRIGIPYDPERTGDLVRDLLSYFKDRPIRLVPMIVRSPSDLAPNVAKIRSEIDALWILPDASFLDPVSAKFLLRYSFSERIPLLAYSEGFSRSGALLSLVADYEDMGRQAAELARLVTSGKKPPRIQNPTRLRTFINIEVANRLNIDVGRSLIVLAERVYPLY